jgi:hypothetical protein
VTGAQLTQVVVTVRRRKQPVESYADFVRQRAASGKIDLSAAESAHTASFLQSIDVRGCLPGCFHAAPALA